MRSASDYLRRDKPGSGTICHYIEVQAADLIMINLRAIKISEETPENGEENWTGNQSLGALSTSVLRALFFIFSSLFWSNQGS